MNENKDYKTTGLFLILLALLTLGVLISAFKTYGDSCQALSCGSTIEKAIVANYEYEWTNDDEIVRLLREGLSEKEIIVKQVSSTTIKGKNYTIRVGLQGTRKPIPTITGATEQERAKEWLENSGLGYTLPTWVVLGEKYELDYTLPLCIAWADSHLGKALASKNNIGNVGNNDRGDRVHYDSMEKGIEAIFRALNNKWMGGSTIVGQLSGEGRKRLNIEGCTETKTNQKCYATSMGVWSTNVTNCLSVIHNKQIEENYQFRF